MYQILSKNQENVKVFPMALDLQTLKKELNPQQYRAVTTIEGPILIIAGAGGDRGRYVHVPLLGIFWFFWNVYL